MLKKIDLFSEENLKREGEGIDMHVKCIFYILNAIFIYLTSIMPVLRSEFLGLENTSYRPRLRVLSVNSFETLCI